MIDFLNISLLAFFGSIAGLAGGILFLLKKQLAHKLSAVAIPFAAGVLLSVSLLHLIPESHHLLGEKAFMIVMISFLFSFLFEQYFAHLHHHEEKKETLKNSSIPLVIFGDTIHNFIDGVTIAAAYSANPVFGVVVSLATFLHETPHEIGDFGVLISRGWSSKKTFIANLFSACATFPGAYLAFYVFKGGEEKVGALLAVSAGVFLYLGASDFLPEVGEETKTREAFKKALFVIAGVFVMYLLSLITPEH